MSIVISAVYQNRLNDIAVPGELVRKLRRADDFIRLAVVAGFEARKKLKNGPDRKRSDTGLILGTAFGTMQTNFEVLDLIVSGEQSSPILFSHSVFNAAAGYTASTLDFQGCALTITDFSFPFFRALQEGCLALLSGRLRRCFVFQVETYSALLSDARKNRVNECREWRPGVVCWVLEKREVGDTTLAELRQVDIEEDKALPMDILDYSVEILLGQRVSRGSDPLAASMKITSEIEKGTMVDFEKCLVSGPCGKVSIQF